MREIPASGITINRSWLEEHQQVGEVGVCAAFTNNASVPAIRIELLYSLLAKDGTPLRSVVHEAKGRFDPGTLIQGESETNCDTAYGVFYRGGQALVRSDVGTMVASVSQIDFADGSWWHAGPDIAGAVIAHTDAGVRLDRAFSWEPGDSTQECIAYSGAGAVRKMHVTFAHIGDDGSDIVDDPFDVYPRSGSATACRGWGGSLTPRVGTEPDDAHVAIDASGKAARLVTWIDEIDYADGTVWRGAQPEPDAVAAAAIPNAVDYSKAVWWPKELEVLLKSVPQAASGIEINRAYAHAFADANECVDFVSHSAKPVTHVRFLFTHVDNDNNALPDTEPLDIRGSYSDGQTKVNNCRGFNGSVVLPAIWQGGRTTGMIYMGGNPSTTTVQVDHVDFADGTSWQAP